MIKKLNGLPAHIDSIKMNFYKMTQSEREFKIEHMLRNEGMLGLRATRKFMRSYRLICKEWAEAKVAPLVRYYQKMKMMRLARVAAAKKGWVKRRSNT